MDRPPDFIPEFDPTLHEYRWKGRLFPSVTTILQATSLIAFPGVDPEVLRQAAERGKVVHELTARIDREETVDVPAEYRGYLRAYHSFTQTFIFTPHAHFTETPLCDPGLEIAGTPDRAGYLQQTAGVVLDIKTFPERQPVIGIQLSGYRHLLRVNGFPAERRLSLHLYPSGHFRVDEYRDHGDDTAFLAALTLYRWRLRNMHRKEAA